MRKIKLLALGLMVTATALAQKSPNGMDEASYRKYVSEIASDRLMGRLPFSKGEALTIDYLQQQFKALGLEPGNKGSYLQAVPMVSIKTNPDLVMQVKGANTDFQLEGFKDYVLWTRRTSARIDLKNEQLVFLGFGISAPEFHHDDYAGVDVKDKIVVVLVNDPGYYDAKQFKGRTMTYYGRWTYKYDEAAKHGAKGCLIIHDTGPAAYAFSVVQNSWKANKLYLDPRDHESYKCAFEGWITMPASEKILAAAGTDYKTMLAKALSPDFKALPLKLDITTGLSTTCTYNQSHNVIARITGSKHPEETIIYSAHWDHFGISKPDAKGDSIYNGAVDNASGTAALLELAKGFKSQKKAPERTIIFLSVTSEEQGLWGSAYYAENPVYPINKTVADINMDMFYPYGQTHDISVVGHGQSDLEDYLIEAAKKQGRYVQPEADPAKGMYFRSDHFNFAKAGVPALYVETGTDLIGKGKEVGLKMHENYTATTYHKPNDEYDASWDVSGTMEDLDLLFVVGKRLAYGDEWPKWKPESEFRHLRP